MHFKLKLNSHCPTDKVSLERSCSLTEEVYRLIFKFVGYYKECKFVATIKFNVKIIGCNKYKIYNVSFCKFKFYDDCSSSSSCCYKYCYCESSSSDSSCDHKYKKELYKELKNMINNIVVKQNKNYNKLYFTKPNDVYKMKGIGKERD